MKDFGAVVNSPSGDVNRPGTVHIVHIFRDSNDGKYYGKLSDGTIELIGGGSGGGAIHITVEAADFVGNDTPAIPDLNGLTPEEGFDVWVHPADGYGGIVTYGTYYTFDAVTNKLTFPGGPERIKIII